MSNSNNKSRAAAFWAARSWSVFFSVSDSFVGMGGSGETISQPPVPASGSRAVLRRICVSAGPAGSAQVAQEHCGRGQAHDRRTRFARNFAVALVQHRHPATETAEA